MMGMLALTHLKVRQGIKRRSDGNGAQFQMPNRQQLNSMISKALMADGEPGSSSVKIAVFAPVSS